MNFRACIFSLSFLTIMKAYWDLELPIPHPWCQAVWDRLANMFGGAWVQVYWVSTGLSGNHGRIANFKEKVQLSVYASLSLSKL